MNLNQNQRKHLSNVLHTLAIAMLAPTVLNLAGFSDKEPGYATISIMFILSLALEYWALDQLKTRSKQDE